jgi:hypothetical protein
MPYHIRKRPNHPNQAKVYAQDGTPLSKKWLTVKQAEKQKIAVQISEATNRKK